MSNWIDGLCQSLLAEQQQRTHRQQVLPSKMNQFWAGLVTTIQSDVTELRSKLGVSASELSAVAKGEAIHVTRIAPTTYYVTIELDARAGLIKIETSMSGDATKGIPTTTVYIQGDLDGADNLILNGKTETRLTAERISQLMLEAILRNSQPTEF